MSGNGTEINTGTGTATDIDRYVTKAMETIRNTEGFENVTFVMLYGSAARDEMTEDSDIDICVGYKSTKTEGDTEARAGDENKTEVKINTGIDAGMFRFRVLTGLSGRKFDIQIFEKLPLYVRVEVLKGKLLYAKEESEVYDIAWRTIKEFDYFKKYYYDYIGLETLT